MTAVASSPLPSPAAAAAAAAVVAPLCATRPPSCTCCCCCCCLPLPLYQPRCHCPHHSLPVSGCAYQQTGTPLPLLLLRLVPLLRQLVVLLLLLLTGAPPRPFLPCQPAHGRHRRLAAASARPQSPVRHHNHGGSSSSSSSNSISTRERASLGSTAMASTHKDLAPLFTMQSACHRPSASTIHHAISPSKGSQHKHVCMRAYLQSLVMLALSRVRFAAPHESLDAQRLQLSTTCGCGGGGGGMVGVWGGVSTHTGHMG